MTEIALVREPVTVHVSSDVADSLDRELAEGVNKLAQEASEVLGYKYLGNLLADHRKKVKVPSELAEVLRDLDIQPFTEESVRSYQREIARKYNRFFSAASFELFNFLTLFLLSGGIFFSIAFLIGEVFQRLSPIPDFPLIWWKWAIGSLLVSLGSFGVRFLSPAYYYEWLTELLSKYQQPIPESVLAKAIVIKKKLPEAEFWVEFIGEAKHDPFLVVKCGGCEYYIDVWKEPKFESNFL